jgi:hypothetical protein
VGSYDPRRAPTEIKLIPSWPAVEHRGVSGSTRMKLPSRTGTSVSPIRQCPDPVTTTYTSSCPDADSSCSMPARSNQLMPKASTPTSRRTNRTTPPGPAPSMSSTLTIAYPTMANATQPAHAQSGQRRRRRWSATPRRCMRLLDDTRGSAGATRLQIRSFGRPSVLGLVSAVRVRARVSAQPGGGCEQRLELVVGDD